MNGTKPLKVIDVDREADVWLNCTRELSGRQETRAWADEVAEALTWGSAAVSWLGSEGPLETPLALVVGAWMTDQPCCEGHYGPDPDDLCSPFGGLWDSRCSGCDDYTVPDIWATMPLAEGAARLVVPEPADIAPHADASLGKWLARYNAEARCGVIDAVVLDRTDAGVEVLTAPSVRDSVAARRLLFGDRPTARSLFEPAVKVHPHQWKLLVGWWAPEPAKGDEIWGARFVTNEQLDATPVTLLGLVSSGQRETALGAARAGTMNGEQLRRMWSAVLEEPPEWLFGPAAEKMLREAATTGMARGAAGGSAGVEL